MHCHKFSRRTFLGIRAVKIRQYERTRDIWLHFKIRSHCTKDASPLVILAHTPRIFTPRLKARPALVRRVWTSPRRCGPHPVTYAIYPPLSAFSCLIANAVRFMGTNACPMPRNRIITEFLRRWWRNAMLRRPVVRLLLKIHTRKPYKKKYNYERYTILKIKKNKKVVKKLMLINLAI